MGTNEPLIEKMQIIIHWSVRVLAILMVFVIILDLEQIEPEYLWGIASVVFAISIGYWLVVKLPRFDLNLGPGKLVQQWDTVGLEENAKSIIARENVAKQESWKNETVAGKTLASLA